MMQLDINISVLSCYSWQSMIIINLIVLTFSCEVVDVHLDDAIRYWCVADHCHRETIPLIHTVARLLKTNFRHYRGKTTKWEGVEGRGGGR